MISGRILVLGGTGLLGRPVVQRLIDKGYTLRLLSRNARKTQAMFGDTVEVAEGSAIYIDDIQSALVGSDAVHINLSPATEYTATKNIVDLSKGQLERICYVSATTLSEANRWFYRVDVKMRTEELLQNSGIPHVVFRPTWVMETLQNFVLGNRAFAVLGKNPPELHFFAAADFGRMVAASYEDERAIGKCLYVYGPNAITLADALKRFVAACYPGAKVIQLKLWQARLVAKLIRNKSLAEVTELIAYLDVAGEHGDPTEADALYGGPTTTLDEWCDMPRDERSGWPH